MGAGLGRILLFLPPFALFAGGVMVLIASPLAWGAGSHVELPDWMTTAAGVSLAVPAVIIGALTSVSVWMRTRGDYEASGFVVFLPIFLFTAFSIIEIALAFRLPDPATYDTLRDENGDITTSPTAFLVITITTVLSCTGGVGGAAYLYTRTIGRFGPAHFEKRMDELDVMGEMMRPRRRPDLDP